MTEMDFTRSRDSDRAEERHRTDAAVPLAGIGLAIAGLAVIALLA
ncbi:MAG: hypothetical protein AB7L41_10300 [Flavobacteriaceae bacterium]